MLAHPERAGQFGTSSPLVRLGSLFRAVITAVTLRRQVVLVLLAGLLTLTPFALASLPDQTWIGGFYDDADYDDVILLVTERFHAVQSPPVRVLLRVSEVIVLVPAMPQPTAPQAVPLSPAGRAPPLA